MSAPATAPSPTSTMLAIDFRTSPERYRHWRLRVEPPLAHLTLDVVEDAGLRGTYTLKQNSYDLAVDIELYASQVKFRFGDIELTTKIIDGKFPDYTRVIPTNYQKHIALNRMLLLQSLQRAAILSNEKFRGVRWMLTGNSLRISCTNNEQEEAQEELEIDYSGEALDVGFNITYLLDVLNNVGSENIDCAFGDANSSMLITLPDRGDYRYVVMPMRI